MSGEQRPHGLKGTLELMMMMILKVMMMLPAASIESDTDVDVCDTIGESNVSLFAFRQGWQGLPTCLFTKLLICRFISDYHETGLDHISVLFPTRNTFDIKTKSMVMTRRATPP